MLICFALKDDLLSFRNVTAENYVNTFVLQNESICKNQGEKVRKWIVNISGCRLLCKKGSYMFVFIEKYFALCRENMVIMGILEHLESLE